MDCHRGCVQAVITSYELHALLKEEMAKVGFVKQGRTWLRSTAELLWLVQLDRSPYGQRFSLDIGVALLKNSKDAAPAKAGDCPILVHLENLPLAARRQAHDARFNDFRSAVIQGFDLSYDLENEEQRQPITSVIGALGKYISEIDDIRGLRARYQAGDLKSAFIRKDMRQLLASD
jgi:hypothetical protein